MNISITGLSVPISLHLAADANCRQLFDAIQSRVHEDLTDVCLVGYDYKNDRSIYIFQGMYDECPLNLGLNIQFCAERPPRHIVLRRAMVKDCQEYLHVENAKYILNEINTIVDEDHETGELLYDVPSILKWLEYLKKNNYYLDSKHKFENTERWATAA